MKELERRGFILCKDGTISLLAPPTKQEGTIRIVRDYRILKALERRGFIICKDGKGRHWSGAVVHNYSVDEGPKLESWNTPFEYKGKQYKLAYFDGCFYPFVVEVGNKPARKEGKHD